VPSQCFGSLQRVLCWSTDRGSEALGKIFQMAGPSLSERLCSIRQAVRLARKEAAATNGMISRSHDHGDHHAGVPTRRTPSLLRGLPTEGPCTVPRQQALCSARPRAFGRRLGQAVPPAPPAPDGYRRGTLTQVGPAVLGHLITADFDRSRRPVHKVHARHLSYALSPETVLRPPLPRDPKRTYATHQGSGTMLAVAAATVRELKRDKLGPACRLDRVSQGKL